MANARKSTREKFKEKQMSKTVEMESDYAEEVDVIETEETTSNEIKLEENQILFDKEDYEKLKEAYRKLEDNKIEVGQYHYNKVKMDEAIEILIDKISEVSKDDFETNAEVKENYLKDICKLGEYKKYSTDYDDETFKAIDVLDESFKEFQKLNEELEAKYGSGNINISNGVFTKA